MLSLKVPVECYRKKIRNETEGIDELLINTRAARFLNALSVNLKLSEHPYPLEGLFKQTAGPSPRFLIQQVGSAARNLHF